MIGSSRTSISLKEILNKVSEADILAFYLGINKIPCVINSPLRKDNRPSFGLYSSDGKTISFKDLSNHDSGGTFDLLGRMWGMSFIGVLTKVVKDIPKMLKGTSVSGRCTVTSAEKHISNTTLNCKIRKWQPHDIQYWESYGISKKWLSWADIYPISHKIITKDGNRYVFAADKYAYAFVEKKEGKVTIKIYQPFNKAGYKWSNKNDKSVVALWTKIPKTGDKLCICSSVKDALCLSANTGIPALALQGEGYSMSKTAIDNLKSRYKNIYILLDNDNPGKEDSKKLAKETGFTESILPTFPNGKDISDAYKALGKEKFLKLILPLFK